MTQSQIPSPDFTVPEQSRLRGFQFLTFRLSSDTQAMLAATETVEVLVLSATQITPIPDMASWVLGAYNWRGDMIWIIDLPQLLELPSLAQQQADRGSYSIVIADIESDFLGLAVPEPGDLYHSDPNLIQSMPGERVSQSLASVLRGYILSEEEEILLVLDATAILERATV